MSYGYGKQNPYAQQNDAQPSYGVSSPGYGGYNSGPAMGRDDYEGRSSTWDRNTPNNPINASTNVGSNVEMEPLTGTGNSFPRQANSKSVLTEIGNIEFEIKQIQKKIQEIDNCQVTILNSSNSKGAQDDRELLMKDFVNMYDQVTKHYKAVKQMPGADSSSSRNAMKRLGGKKTTPTDKPNDLEALMIQYKVVLNKYTDGLSQQAERQYMIVNPDASREQVEDAIESGGPMFSQAMMQSNRRGQAQSALNAVAQRNAALNKIDQQMIQLAELFQEMDQLVVQQEAAVTNIEMKGEEVNENMQKGTEQIGVAIESARNTRKWKWWCLGIVVLIIVIIVVVVLIYKFVIQTPATTTTAAAKRFVLTDSVPASRLSTAGHAVIPGKDFTSTSKSVVPGLEWKGDRLVVPGVDYVSGSRKTRRFQA